MLVIALYMTASCAQFHRLRNLAQWLGAQLGLRTCHLRPPCITRRLIHPSSGLPYHHSRSKFHPLSCLDGRDDDPSMGVVDEPLSSPWSRHQRHSVPDVVYKHAPCFSSLLLHVSMTMHGTHAHFAFLPSSSHLPRSIPNVTVLSVHVAAHPQHFCASATIYCQARCASPTGMAYCQPSASGGPTGSLCPILSACHRLPADCQCSSQLRRGFPS